MGVEAETRVSSGFTRESPTVTLRCRNCDAELTGPYCAQCGQRDLPPNPTLAELFAEVWDAYVSIDGKFFQTLALLIRKPGELTVRYLDGRRAAYIPPFRLYLVCSLVYFFGVSTGPKIARAFHIGSPATNDTIQAGATLKIGDSTIVTTRVDASKATKTDTLGDGFTTRLKRGAVRSARDKISVQGLMLQNIEKALFVLVPVYALLVQLFYWRRKRRFPAHLVFALHGHALFFSALLVFGLVKALTPKPVDGFVDLLMFASLFAWFTVAFHVAYGGRRGLTVLRTFVIGALYSMIGLAALGVGIIGYFWVAGG